MVDNVTRLCCYIESDSLSFHSSLKCCIMFGMPILWFKSYISHRFKEYCIMFCWVQHVAFHHPMSIKAWTQTLTSFLDLFFFESRDGDCTMLFWLFDHFCWIHVSRWIFYVLTTGSSSSDKCCFDCFLCFKINSIITPLVCFLLRFSCSWRNRIGGSCPG